MVDGKLTAEHQLESRADAGVPFIAISPAMKRIDELVTRAGASKASIVIVGEANTGKEFIARQIHARSEQSGDRLLTLDGFGAPEALVAAVGTARGPLFVREVAAMSRPLQLKVLRSCAEPTGGARPRLLATATRRPDGGQDADASSFREDLYRQQGVIIIEVPPLRERRADIVPLARLFLARARSGIEMTLAPEVERELEAYPWPENLAELERVMTKGAAKADAIEVTLDALDIAFSPPPGVLTADMSTMRYREMLDVARERLAREYFSTLLRETEGNVTHAARRAGIGRESLHRILNELGLAARDFRRE